MQPATILRAAFTLALTSLAPASADVITVDSLFGAGADHLEIQPAVDAAQAGDVILVAPGTYAGFEIAGRSMSVVADAGGTVFVTSGVLVRDLAVGQRVSLIGLKVVPFPPSNDSFEFTQADPGLVVRDCLGAVRVERSSIFAPTLSPGDGYCEGLFGTFPPGHDAMQVESSADVVLNTVVLEGGFGIDDGGDFQCLGWGSQGGRGLLVTDSRVHLHNVVARGAAGAVQGLGGDGGAAVDVRGSSELLASGLIATGGDGGHSNDFIGSDGIGEGGDGLLAEAGTTVYDLGGVYTGGAPGFTCCWTNPPGEGRVIDGVHAELPGMAHRFVTPAPAREGEDLVLTLTGGAGDSAFLFVGLTPTFLVKPALGGALYLAPPFAIGPSALLTLPGGIVSVPVPIPELGPGIDVLIADMQVFVLEADGDKVLTGPAHAVLLDGAF